MGRQTKINGDCPFLSERSSYYGHEPFQCDYTGKEITSDEYYHLCRYDNKAKEDCPMRRRDYHS